ncbi:hypothetical protein [Leptolyngbya sp. FACHB-261]|uniref:hypothetical protein n=1 Tax=Leptolyngbya sp. FACHB-261 TaxID=2692806 RepID=UPI0016864AA2|nr:hypothetical protein [Leptolyngbya sp. FACHB-261]MBD2102159.1 hypothetical protein [Leptolyngbya sp. FACHB-261]
MTLSLAILEAFRTGRLSLTAQQCVEQSLCKPSHSPAEMETLDILLEAVLTGEIELETPRYLSLA